MTDSGHRESVPILGTFDSLRQWGFVKAIELILGHNMRCTDAFLIAMFQIIRSRKTPQCQSESCKCPSGSALYFQNVLPSKSVESMPHEV